MRGERARDTRHNKNHDNLKSSLKKGSKSKKHRVVFDESANEFFEADYIIVVRDDCGFSDDGEGDDCSGCGSCELFQEPEPGALSPPEGYKDMGLFNRDGTLREQAWWETGDVVLVGERSGTVFTPQHLQLLKRLQRERMLRSTICADCDAHAALHQPIEMEYGYEEDETSDVDREYKPTLRRTAKHIAAGEERPRINSSQQTTPIDECPSDLFLEEPHSGLTSAALTSEESDTGENDGHLSSDNSPMRHRRGGILKGGKLWKSIDHDKDSNEQTDDQRSTTTASDEDCSVTPRSVRFTERTKEHSEEELTISLKPEAKHHSDNEEHFKEYNTNTKHRLETPLTLTIHTPKQNSAVQQLFNSGRPPPPAIEAQLVTSETLRAWDVGVRPKAEEVAVRRVAERNALRCSLLRSETRKKQQPKQETASLAERIRLLTCDVEEEADDRRTSPSGASSDKMSSSSDKSSEKSFNSIDKNSEKAFGSASSSSSSSTISAPVPTRQQPPDLGDVHQEPQKTSHRQFLSTLAPLTACVGSVGHHEGFYYVPPGDRVSASSVTTLELQDHNDAPAPDIVAGTPGAVDGDDGLAAFARATAPRTERLKQRYGQESQTVTSDDEHDDYGFHRRPAVRGISIKQQLGASDEILQQMQNELQPSPSTTSAQSMPAHSCQRTNTNYSWPYYSEANLNSRPQSRNSSNCNWSKSSDYVSVRQCNSTPPSQRQHADTCYSHAHNATSYAHYQHRQHADVYRNCSLYANIGCSDSSQELYSSQTSSEHTSPVRSGSRCRRPESPPPIRNHHQLLYVPYSTHYHYEQQEYAPQWTTNEYSGMHSYYQQQVRSGTSTPQPTATPPQRAHYAHSLQLQTLCPAPARYRSVSATQAGSGKQMICYSEKVAAPLYQPAPGSPSRSSRGAPEGAPSGSSIPTATSPMGPPPNPVYYAMNV